MNNRRMHRRRKRRVLSNSHDTVRSWRNRNPLNVRPMTLPQTWQGQTAVDQNTGGPFAVFGSRAEGWACAYNNLIAYQDIYGLRTIREIVSRWAPSSDNNDEVAYSAVLADLTGWTTGEVLDLHDAATLLNLGDAMAVMEGGRLPWPAADRLAALVLVGVSQKLFTQEI